MNSTCSRESAGREEEKGEGSAERWRRKGEGSAERWRRKGEGSAERLRRKGEGSAERLRRKGEGSAERWRRKGEGSSDKKTLKDFPWKVLSGLHPCHPATPRGVQHRRYGLGATPSALLQGAPSEPLPWPASPLRYHQNAVR
jgi:hypothetical protein